MSGRTLKVGMLGCGNVGSGVAQLLSEHAEDLAARVGARLELAAVGVRDLNKTRENVDPEIITDDLEVLVRRPDIDLIVEVMGGIEPARSLLLTAMANGKSIVTANKALLAEDGITLYEAAEKHQVDLYYEAAVAGAIPLLRPIRESMAGDQIERVLGIVNGTTNYILTRMDEAGVSFADALKEATELGYAETDPTADIEGFDAAAKAAILAGLAFHSRVTALDVYREGISQITTEDIASAKAMGHVIKLLAIAELTSDDHVSVRVHPALLPRNHPLAAVREAFNAVFVEARAAGELMFYGRGAGGIPTASAVLGDLVAVARHRVFGGLGSRESDYAAREIALIGEATTRYHIRLDVADRPGVLAAVAQAFAHNEVSIQTVRQGGHGDDAELVVVTHSGVESALAATVSQLRAMDIVRNIASVIRVEGGSRE
ncbi:MAG TPA: homoserine dehydrogenase [Candidatus Nanopelagicaceae bacterium]|nr:homoserine dehydrogenase [Candidatus Nanopelagicaceae bacterium]